MLTKTGRRLFPVVVYGSLLALAGVCFLASGGCELDRLCPVPPACPDEVSIQDMLLDDLQDLRDAIGDRIEDWRDGLLD